MVQPASLCIYADGPPRTGDLKLRPLLYPTLQPHSTAVCVSQGPSSRSANPRHQHQLQQFNNPLCHGSRSTLPHYAGHMIPSASPLYQNVTSFKSANTSVAGNGHHSLASEVLQQRSIDSHWDRCHANDVFLLARWQQRVYRGSSKWSCCIIILKSICQCYCQCSSDFYYLKLIDFK